jgi:phosphatidate cytidylyltransferase
VLWTRVASGVVLAPLFLVLVYFAFPFFNGLVAMIAGIVAWEFTRMDGKAGTKRRALVTTSTVAAIAAMSLGYGLLAYLIVLASTIVLVVADQRAGRKGFYIVQMAIIYAAVPGLCLLYVMTVGGSRSVFWLLAVVWATDIGAYAFGRMIGGPKLAPSVSPNKTWSGAIGGLASGVLSSTALLFWGYEQHATAALLLLAAVVSVASQSGDLFESALKRRYQVKDSGGLIPGHGGLMDRFDGLWAGAPVAALISLVLGGGVQSW